MPRDGIPVGGHLSIEEEEEEERTHGTFWGRGEERRRGHSAVQIVLTN
jgi:hypothetical protein